MYRVANTHLHNKDGSYVTKVYRKETREIQKKHYQSRSPSRSKDSTNFKEEIKFIRNKFIKADFPLPFINSVIKDFNIQQKIAQQNEEELSISFVFL